MVLQKKDRITMKSPRIQYRTLALLQLTTLVSIPLCAQQPPPPYMLIPHISGNQAVSEKEMQTIEKCTKDYKSKNTAVRLRAVMVLSKYRNHAATAVLINALDDPEVKVRRSAIVGLAEHPIPPITSAIPLLERLQDKDLQVRRTASALASKAFSQFNFALLAGSASRANDNNTTTQKKQKNRIGRIIRNAFRDNDQIVRKNMVESYHFFSQLIAPDILIPMIRDKNRDIRILALRALESSVPDSFNAVAGGLANDKDRYIRLFIAQNLNKDREGMAENILKNLSEDSDFEVAAAACINLASRGILNNEQQLINILDNKQTDAEQGNKLIRTMHNLPPENALNLLKKTLSHKRPDYRESAAYTIREIPNGSLDISRFTEPLLNLLEDPSSAVREVASRTLFMKKMLTEKHVPELMRSRFANIRTMVFQLLPKLDEEKAKQTITDLLIDEVDTVRAQALSVAASYRIGGWQDYAGSALLDDSEIVQRQAVNLLLQTNTPATDEILADNLSEIKDERLKAVIINKLRTKRKALPLTPRGPTIRSGKTR